ncbi:segregation/condensation protein A [Nitrospira defluvii]|nr:segregation/condensation protein A [Nitrospira defluvii]
MDTETSYEIKLEEFEGPLELLLHLIKKNEINIYDIPIAPITEQYLEALNLMGSLNLASAGEFLVMAATLIHIKSKMLLPTSSLEEEDDDPRSDLVSRLLEYQQYKEAAEQFQDREALWRDIYGRGPVSTPELSPEEIPIADLGLYDLLDALNDLLEQRPNPAVMEITTEMLTVKEKMQLILDQIDPLETILFEELFTEISSRHAIVVTFLALLEVIRLGLIRVLQGEVCGPLRLLRTENIEKS